MLASNCLEEGQEQDLSDQDFSQFKPMKFEFENKDARINMRLPETLLAAVKKAAEVRDIPYQRFFRQVLEEAVAGHGAGRAGS